MGKFNINLDYNYRVNHRPWTLPKSNPFYREATSVDLKKAKREDRIWRVTALLVAAFVIGFFLLSLASYVAGMYLILKLAFFSW